jgi:hypothetical protein
VRLRAGATTEEVARDLFRLYAAVDRLDRSSHGTGLAPDDATYEATATDAKLRINFKPTDSSDAWERLTGLVRVINGADAAASSGDDAWRHGSIESCEAQVIPPAA